MPRLCLALVVLALLAAGCGSSKRAPATTATSPAPAASSTTRAAARSPREPAKKAPASKGKQHSKTSAKTTKTSTERSTKTSATKAKTTATTAKTSRTPATTSTTTTSTTTAPTTTTPATTKTPTTTHPAAPTGAAVDSRSSLLGRILVDSHGRTLYLFKKDTGPSSTCYGSCAVVWPPLTTSGTPVAGSGVRASLLGTTARRDGKTQVTYDHHPLYYFAGDTGAGATNGQGIAQFGAKWWVVSPAGHAIKRR